MILAARVYAALAKYLPGSAMILMSVLAGKCCSRLAVILALISRKLTSAPSASCPGNPPPISSSCSRTPSLAAALNTDSAAEMARLNAADSRHPDPTWKLKHL